MIMSFPRFTWQSGLKYTEIRLQTLQGKDIILSLENNFLCWYRLSDG